MGRRPPFSPDRIEKLLNAIGEGDRIAEFLTLAAIDRGKVSILAAGMPESEVRNAEDPGDCGRDVMARKKINGFDWHEGAVFEALETIHPSGDQWILVPQIPDATSWDKRRTADAMAFGCWRSVGIAVHGYEIKVARSDWLREIQDPEKAKEFSNRCNYWWIAAPEGIVKPEELPADWGLRIVTKTTDGYSVRVKKGATFREVPNFDVAFVVALARACWRKSPERRADEEALAEAFRKGEIEGRKETAAIPYEYRNAKAQLDALKAEVAKFETESGITIRGWEGRNIGPQVKAFRDLGEPEMVFGGVVEKLERLLKLAREVAGPAKAVDNPAWIRCLCEDEFFCTIHGKHTAECDCPEIDDLDFDPYTTGGKPVELRTCESF